ncbi:hypothetical protein TNCT6_59130 [Streptomyces sp. 6-11-2]|nr:hypothetical protein TNCT6_59130 [Streptomyces sp. 6-11-2]
MEVAADQLIDVAIESGREEHPLTVEVHLVEDVDNLRQESQVAHLVGLVQHGGPYPSQAAGVALDQVVQASRGGDDHLGSLAQLGDLPPIDMPPTTVAIRSRSAWAYGASAWV